MHHVQNFAKIIQSIAEIGLSRFFDFWIWRPSAILDFVYG